MTDAIYAELVVVCVIAAALIVAVWTAPVKAQQKPFTTYELTNPLGPLDGCLVITAQGFPVVVYGPCSTISQKGQ